MGQAREITDYALFVHTSYEVPRARKHCEMLYSSARPCRGFSHEKHTGFPLILYIRDADITWVLRRHAAIFKLARPIRNGRYGWGQKERGSNDYNDYAIYETVEGIRSGLCRSYVIVYRSAAQPGICRQDIYGCILGRPLQILKYIVDNASCMQHDKLPPAPQCAF